jgi:hypothetical protein
MEMIYRAFDWFLKEKAVLWDSDENPDDIRETVVAFAEMVVVPPLGEEEIRRDVALILSIFGYLSSEMEKKLGLNPIYPKPQDIREYIKRQRKKIARDTRKEANRRTGVKARVKGDGFRKLRKGEYLSPLDAFAFFSGEQE